MNKCKEMEPGSKIAVIIVILMILGVNAPSFAAEPAAENAVNGASTEALMLNGKAITIRDVIKIVLDNNISAKALMYEAVMSDSSYRKFQDKFKLNVNAEGAYYGDLSGKAYLSKNFRTGTYIEAGAINGYYAEQSVFNSLGKHADDNENSVYGFITIKQELLNNAFGYTDREQTDILKTSADISMAGVMDRMSELISAAIYECWNLSIKQSTVKNAGTQLDSVKQVRDIIARNLEYGLSESYDLNQYNAAVASAESSYFSAEYEYKKALRSLLRVMNMKGENTLEGGISIEEGDREPDEAKSITKAYEKRNDYKNALADLENAKKTVRMYGNASWPSLTASYTAETEEFKNKPDWGAELALNIPIGDSENSVNLRNAELELKEASDKLDLKKTEVRDDIIDSIDGIKATKYTLDKMKKASSETGLYYSRMFTKFKQGKINAATLKVGLDNLLTARQEELNAYISYNMALLQYDIAVNELFENNGIDIKKYIENAKENK
jgi:outer membrane protein TolC